MCSLGVCVRCSTHINATGISANQGLKTKLFFRNGSGTVQADLHLTFSFFLSFRHQNVGPETGSERKISFVLIVPVVFGGPIKSVFKDFTSTTPFSFTWNTYSLCTSLYNFK